jgi:4-amino-4-deoxy-L-arabinose transferase-like glycosyltransferase
VRNPGERLAPAVWAVAALKLLAHLLTTGRFGYEYFVDELYFNACAKHLAWGYIDMPPFHAAVTAAVKAALGDSLLAIRLLPALAGAALVLLAGLLARDLGGGKWAQLLAAICVAVAPIFFVMHGFSSMNAWEPLL